MKDINFVDTDTETIKKYIIEVYEGITGVTLARADPVRLFLEAMASIIAWQMNNINYSAKMNLLAFSEGDFLDCIGELVGCTRLEASKATTTIQATLSAVRTTTVSIPSGTRVSTADNIIFETTENAEIAIGSTTVNIPAACMVEGEAGNNYAVGEISQIVDHIAYVATMTNTTVSEGGSDEESDDDYRERIQEAPESFGSGTKGWYKNHTKEVSDLIGDVFVEGPEDRASGSQRPGEVDIYPLCKDGTIPGAELRTLIQTYLTSSNVHYLTDKVTVLAPTETTYNINLTYYIDSDDALEAPTIQTAVNTAIANYISWQREKLGRDINPSKLVSDIVNAGAKRCVITSPVFTVVSSSNVAKVGTQNIVYGGLEDG